MKILYISPENTVGTLSLWKKAHEKYGNECTIITLYNTKHHDNEGICLNLPLIKSNSLYMKGRHWYYKFARHHKGDYRELEGYPPTWEPNSMLEKAYFSFRDWLWHFKVDSMINKLNLLDYDIFHLEWGLEFYRDGRFVKELKKLNKPIICTYHGQDLRTRGVIPIIDQISKLNLTSELDLISKHPNLKYLFLPFDTQQYKPEIKIRDTIRICHSPTNRYYKGSDTIIPICDELAKKKNIEFVLIENKSYAEAQKIKKTCDIFIDQLHNRGGWGYGMSSVESLSMGLCCITELVPEYQQFIPDHPFISADSLTLKSILENLINNPKKILKYKEKSRNWVVKHHDVNSVAKILYNYYNQMEIV